jgi:phage shock protein E
VGYTIRTHYNFEVMHSSDLQSVPIIRQAYLGIALCSILLACKPNVKTTTPVVSESTATEVLSDTDHKEGYKNIEIAQARGILKDRPEVIFLDVRTPSETADGMIQGAIQADVTSDDFLQLISDLDKTKEYVVYCKSGGRSKMACEKMKELGFHNLNNMEGGYSNWSK